MLALLTFGAIKLTSGLLLTAYPEWKLRIEYSEPLLERYRMLSVQKPQLSAYLNAVQSTLADREPYLISVPSDTLAGAALQNQVRKIVESVGGVLRSSQILPLETVEPGVSLKRVRLKLVVLIQVTRLQDILYDLEVSRPAILIDEITISAANTGELSGAMASDAVLQVRMEVYGLLG